MSHRPRPGFFPGNRFATLTDSEGRFEFTLPKVDPAAAGSGPIPNHILRSARSTLANQRSALVTGISGQDGSYLSELLLEKGYEVHGIVRRVAIEDPQHRLSRIQHLLGRIHLHAASLESYPSLMKVVAAVQPDEVYHLAAQSYVSYSFEDEFSTFEVNVNGTHYLLSACRDIVPKARFYFAGSSEMFGSAPAPQNELTAFRPRSAYGISKVAGYHLRNYRRSLPSACLVRHVVQP